MKLVCVCLLVLVASAAAAETAKEQEWEEPKYTTTDGDSDFTALLETKFVEPNLGYVPTSTPTDNPAVQSALTPAIPSSPDCTVRPQTIVEIHRMRRSAAHIATMIETEVAIMQKRKTYIEQMTAYLNDRIRELNKVKSELAQENRWIEMSNKRIEELAHQEKLIKAQDILACLHDEQERMTGNSRSQAAQIKAISQAAQLTNSQINKIRSQMKNLADGKSTAAAEAVTSL